MRIYRMNSLLPVYAAVVMLALCGNTMAAPITRQQAQQQAREFLQGRGKSVSASSIRHAMSRRGAPSLALEPYYVFNVGDDDGFVLVSGDDRTLPVLGYADRGQFTVEDMPDNLRGWLEGYEKQLAYLQEKEISADASMIARAPQRAKTAISPLLTSTWNQRYPYNNSCPVYNGMCCATGCVATAMAQLMYYYRWPNLVPNPIPGYVTANLGQEIPTIPLGPIDWNNMLPSYDDVDATEAQQKAVADLMFRCGASVEMMYGPKASGAYDVDVPKALTSYFCYDRSIQHLSRSSFSKDEWERLLDNELDGSHPVLYFGQSVGGGHAFVIDGRDQRGYYHVNWGWSGHSDGYFLLSILNPYNNDEIGSSSTSDGFSLEQVMLTNVKPDSYTDSQDDILLTTSISASQTTFSRSSVNDDFTGVPIEMRVESGGVVGLMELGIGVFDNAGNAVKYIADDPMEFTTPFNRVLCTNSIDFGSGLVDGSYVIAGVSRNYGHAVWHKNYGSNTQYLTAVVSGNKLTITNPSVSLTGTVSLAQQPEVGADNVITATITNNGTDFNGDLYLFANGIFSGGTNFEAKAGQTAEWSFEYKPSNPGITEFTVASEIRWEKETQTYSMVTPVASTTESVKGFLLETALEAINCDDNNNVTGSTLKLKASLTNLSAETYNHPVRFRLFKLEEGTTYSSGDAQENVSIYSGETKTVTHYFAGLESGKTYFGLIEYYSANDFYINGAQSEMYVMGADSYANLSITENTANATNGIVKENKIVARASVKNNGSQTYDNVILGRLYKLRDDGSGTGDFVTSVQEPILVQPGKSASVDLTFNDLEDGNSYFYNLYYWSEGALTGKTQGSVVTVQVEQAPTLKGDVNGDGEVNVTDLVPLVNMILGITQSNAAADVNGDGEVNVTDLVPLVNLILKY